MHAEASHSAADKAIQTGIVTLGFQSCIGPLAIWAVHVY